ncbi:MAG: hypothetical protein GX200_08785 [Firmicutes bacterium]|nr:hypothetical protein [Bacillota bacterium]
MKLEQYKEYIPATVTEIRHTMQQLYRRFIWTQDDAGKLFDSIDTPASAWDKAFSNPPLKDDCDGFHAALYWAVSFNFPCRLLTVATRKIKDSHTVLVIRDGQQYYLANYNYLSRPLATMADVLQELQQTYYKNRADIIAWELSCWNGRRWESCSF